MPFKLISVPLINSVTSFNLFFMKNALIFVIFATMEKSAAEAMSSLGVAVFMIPTIFMAGVAGQIADKIDRYVLLIWIKGADVLAVSVSIIGIYVQSPWMIIGGLFMQYFLLALFVPIRTHLISDIYGSEKILKVSGWLESLTMVAMIVGLWSVGLAFSLSLETRYIFLGVSFFMSFSAFVGSMVIPRYPQQADVAGLSFNVVSQMNAALRYSFSQSHLIGSMLILGISHFLGTLFLSTTPAVLFRFGADAEIISWSVMVYGVFGALGSHVAGSSMRQAGFLTPIKYTFAVKGCVMATLGFLMLAKPLSEGYELIFGTVFLIAIFGFAFHFSIITLMSYFLMRGDKARLGVLYGGSAIITGFFIVLGSFLMWFLQNIGFDIMKIYILIGLLSILFSVILKREWCP